MIGIDLTARVAAREPETRPLDATPQRLAAGAVAPADPSPGAVEAAVAEALSRIPPAWPLTHFVAVNPFLGLLDRPFEDACALLRRTAGAAPLLSAGTYRELHRDGTIAPEDLAAVADETWTAERLVQELSTPSERTSSPVTTLAQRLDARVPHPRWQRFVTDEIARWCAAHLDESQALWSSPWRDRGLYAAWREAALHDRNPEAFGVAGFRRTVARLPEDPDAAIDHCVRVLGPWADALADVLHAHLHGVSGWASHLRYLDREDELRGRAAARARDLLAMRLAYAVALRHAHGDVAEPPRGADPRPRVALAALVRWQRAYEAGYQRTLAHALMARRPVDAPQAPRVQAVFCIDVRSEVLRRHLEEASPSVSTLGFAGFFGFAVAHRLPGEEHARARCPVLLVPAIDSDESGGPLAERRAARRRRGRSAWKAVQSAAASCFSFVECAGVGFAATLARLRADASRPWRARAPHLVLADEASVDAMATMAEGALRNMGLTRGFARLVLLCGHGSRSANNPYASALGCGACGGHAGDVNARLASAALNHPAVRERLARRGIVLPPDTWAVAGLHDTMTDEVELFDVETVPASHADDLVALRDALAAAGAGARRERAPSLGLGPMSDGALVAALEDRANEIAQVRPEWGLAGNAALVAAPRARTRGRDLGGRVFLHEYRHEDDPDAAVLTMILSAPVVVASWINLQYYASRVDPERYGAGNKVLHNVVGGIGVLEGNGGDLRTGLPLQSIHDGERFVHEPRRLSVFVEAPRDRIDRVLAARPDVRRLFSNGWISLFAIEGDACARYEGSGWSARGLGANAA